jgi:iron complex outermembrane receptor protein
VTSKMKWAHGLSILAMVAAGITMPAIVQAQPAASSGQSFHLDRKGLSAALKDFSRATGLQVVASPDLVRGKASQSVSGTMTPKEALSRLLSGTGLSGEIIDGSVIVRAQPASSPPKPGTDRAEDEAVTEVIVTGYAKAMSDSVEDKRRSKNISDRVSADDMGELPVENVAEALAKVPGVNAVRDSRTGEGDRITIRGLSTELNNYTMNGVRMSGTGSRDENFYRGVRLSFLPPEGISGITVHKTIMPNMDGDALGGTVDIDTPTAFDFKPLHIGGAVEVSSMDKFDHKTSGKASLSVGRQFSDRLGLFVTASYAKRYTQFEENGGDGDSQPRKWYADSETLDADLNDFVFRGMQIDTGNTEVERKGINSTLDWRGDDHEFHLRGTYNTYNEKEFSNRLNFRNDTSKNSTRLVQVDTSDTSLIQPDDAIIGTGAKGNIYSYTTSQIVDRDGDGVITDADKNGKSLYSLNGGSGTWDPQGFRLRRFWEGSYSSGLLSSLNFGGVSHFGHLKIDYDLSTSTSEDNLDGGYTLEFRTDEYGWLGNEGVGVDSSADSRYPKWVLNAAGLAAVQDPANYNFASLEAEVSANNEKLNQAQFNLTYDFDNGWLRNVKAGGKLYDSKRHKYEGAFLDLSHDGTMADFSAYFGKPVTNLFDGQYTGVYQLGVVLDDDKMLAELQKASAGTSTFFEGTALDPSSAIVSVDDTFDFDEKITAAYLMGEAQFGKLNVIGGVRVEKTENAITAYTYDAVQGNEFEESSSEFTNVLPSLHMTYGIRRDLLLRGAIWTSFARPDIARMSSAREYSYNTDPDGDGNDNPTSEWQLIAITQGNPDLKPMRAINYDLSLEWYRGKTGAYSLAFYHKDIKNFLYRSSSSNIRNGTEGTNTDPNGVVVSMPNNGKKATVTGMEFNARQLLYWLPKPFDGLGIGVNGTIQTSKAVTGLSWHPEGYTLPLMETPDNLLNVELFYEKNGWEAYLSYNYQSEMLQGIQDFGNNPWEQDYTFVNMNIRKKLSRNATISLNGQNLLDNPTYWVTYGKSEASSRAYIKNGRTISVAFNWIY